MSSTMMMERTSTGYPTLGGAPVHTPAPMPTHNYMMVPRCTFKVEKCTGGLKLTCLCEDKVASSMVQNLCQMLAGGMCSCCCTLNGMTVCHYNLTMGMCRCEPTDSGCVMTCTSGDPSCEKMIQCCADSLCCMLEAGCTCSFLMNNTPVCCGVCDSKHAGKPKGK